MVVIMMVMVLVVLMVTVVTVMIMMTVGDYCTLSKMRSLNMEVNMWSVHVNIHLGMMGFFV